MFLASCFFNLFFLDIKYRLLLRSLFSGYLRSLKNYFLISKPWLQKQLLSVIVSWFDDILVLVPRHDVSGTAIGLPIRPGGARGVNWAAGIHGVFGVA